MRKSLAILALLFFSVSSWAQHTTVTAVVQDANSTLYTNCNGSASFVGQNLTPGAGPYLLGGSVFQTSVPISCDSSANMQVSLADNNQIRPTPSQWRFTICAPVGLSPGAVPPPICFNALITITGATEDITSALQAAAAIIPPGGGGGGGGTLTGVTTMTGSGLEGGGTSGLLHMSLLTICGSGQVLQWSGSTWGCASLTQSPNLSVSFTNSTSATLTVSSSTVNIISACYDNSSPANVIDPASTTLDLSTYLVTFTFAVPQSGYCVVNQSGGLGGSGGGTITGVNAGSGLQGGGTSGLVNLSLLTSCSLSQVLQWNGTGWVCATITGGGGGGFSIASFSGGSTVEIGATVASPAFTASYSSLPTSASISNTDNIDSPLALTTPFTSGTVVGNFVHATQTSTTFTLTAVSGSNYTATQSISWIPRSFGGVGAPGATSSVTASGNTAVLSTSDVLANAGLASSDVGTTYGPYTASSQSIYLLLIGGSHTFFKDAGGFLFPFNTPTSVSFVNQNGATVPMYLYQSSNTLTGAYSILVVN